MGTHPSIPACFSLLNFFFFLQLSAKGAVEQQAAGEIERLNSPDPSAGCTPYINAEILLVFDASKAKPDKMALFFHVPFVFQQMFFSCDSFVLCEEAALHQQRALLQQLHCGCGVRALPAVSGEAHVGSEVPLYPVNNPV